MCGGATSLERTGLRLGFPVLQGKNREKLPNLVDLARSGQFLVGVLERLQQVTGCFPVLELTGKNFRLSGKETGRTGNVDHVQVYPRFCVSPLADPPNRLSCV